MVDESYDPGRIRQPDIEKADPIPGATNTKGGVNMDRGQIVNLLVHKILDERIEKLGQAELRKLTDFAQARGLAVFDSVDAVMMAYAIAASKR